MTAREMLLHEIEAASTLLGQTIDEKQRKRLLAASFENLMKESGLLIAALQVQYLHKMTVTAQTSIPETNDETSAPVGFGG